MTKLKDNLFFLNYLKAEKIYFDNEEFNFQLSTHPEYPSLLAYHDALNFFNIPNITVKIEDNDISNLPDYFIGEIQSKLAFVKKKSNSFIIDFGDGKNNDFSIKEFNNLWSGVVLAAESGIKEKRKINTSLLRGIFSVLFIVVMSFFSFNLSIFSIFILCGIFFSIEAVKQDLNIQSDFSNKFCNISKETDCNTIIKSNSFKLFNYFGLSDISIVFFSGQLLGLLGFLFLDFVMEFFVYSFGVLFLSVPILFASLFYQWRIAKKWCVICLGIISILIIELLYCTFYNKEFILLDFSFQKELVILFLSFFILSLAGWLLIKPFISSYFTLKSENTKLFKFKRNYNLFKNTLISDRKVHYQNLKSDLFLGNKDAKLKLTLVTNPLCKFCKETHSVIELLIKKHSNDLRINIFFNFYAENNNSNKKDPIKNLHLKLIENYLIKGPIFFLESLGDWFSNKDYNNWFNKFGENKSNDKEYIELLKKQYDQNTVNKVQFTPSLFIGEFSYPLIYDKKDILLYIYDLLEDEDILV
jgi:hypothetical protein